MKRRLIIHIGAHRTATSALQMYLKNNVKLLRQNGYLYPFQVRRHLKLMNDIFAGRREVSEVAQTVTARADTRPELIHTVILSDEDICLRRDLSVLAAFRDEFDVKIVFTLRRQDTWLESWFFQNIKWQWNEKLSHCTFDEFLAQREDFHWIHYNRFVRHLEDLFGKENIILNVHEKSQMQGGPIETFCNSIGLTERDEFTEPTHANASFSATISEFMRHLPLDEAPAEYRDMLTRICWQIDKQQNGGASSQSERLLPYADRVSLLEEYADGNRNLAQRYFDRDTLFLEELPAPDAPLANMALPSDTTVLMEQFVAPLVRATIRNHKTGAALLKSQRGRPSGQNLDRQNRSEVKSV